MTPISWLTVTATAARLGLPVEEIQQLVDAGSLNGRWIHDHLSISEESVEAYLLVADAEDATAEHLAERVEDSEAWPTPRDPCNPAEGEMTPDDNETYREEQKK
ncbi:helix-turn-helix domain-containing protein [Streptosporangium sp. NPDC051022]|uniref:helix-turn-helix domain-containing protein n=1 Tax=Streptosporangium sp. NPDC051022 TaxID=3155752 RepID=UPI00342AC425